MTDSQCQFTGCTRVTITPTRAWCSTHDSASRRGERSRVKRATGSTRERDSEGRKWCPRCERWLTTDQFYSHPIAADGLKTPCGRCMRLRQFGITAADYDAMLTAQDGRCAICRRPPRGTALAVDHHHGTGNVRALLCGNCNTALGLFQDSPDLLDAARRYLTVHV